MKYPIAPSGIYWSIQGEGVLLGVPMHFVRLAGCSVGCPECDTDYSVAERLSIAEIVERLQRLPRAEWVWLTGGEPTDHDIGPLVAALESKVALATAGIRSVPRVDFLSVSPHRTPTELKVEGDQLNLVPGLNGLQLDDWRNFNASGFTYRYVTGATPECIAFVREHSGWRLGLQAHKHWGLH